MNAPTDVTNHFKAALKNDAAQIGLWLALADPYSAEICAGGGFDFLVLDGEHSPLDLRTMLAQLQSIASYPVHPIIRPAVGDAVIIKQMLDIGAQTLLIPMVETVEQAQDLVSATRYPPEGVRGVGAAIARAARWGTMSGYLETANDQVCLLLQVETKKGLDNLDGIAALDGVDGVFLGAADLSASMGYLGRPDHPVVQAAMEKAVERINSHGKAAGFLATEDDMAHKFLSLGARFVAVGVDALLLSSAARRLAARFKDGRDEMINTRSPY